MLCTPSDSPGLVTEACERVGARLTWAYDSVGQRIHVDATVGVVSADEVMVGVPLVCVTALPSISTVA